MIRASVVEALDRPDKDSSLYGSFMESVKALASDYGVIVRRVAPGGIEGKEDVNVMWICVSMGGEG